MKGYTKLIHSNGMVTYCLPYNHKRMQEYWNDKRRREVQKIEDYIEGLDNKDACIALRVLLHRHRNSKKVHRIMKAFGEGRL